MKSKIDYRKIKPVLIALFLLFVLNPTIVSANMAAPSQGGTRAAEPNGLENIFVLRETLTIDFRQLAEMQSVLDERTVLVEALYRLENRSTDKSLELVFVTGTERASDFQLWLDDKPIVGTISVQSKELPENWRLPNDTPWENGQELQFVGQGREQSLIKFYVTIPAGKHTMRASYGAEPAQYSDLEPLKAWQFAYILAPVRDWAGFGGLDVSILLPAGWAAVTLPELNREGDVLRGSFEAIPADSIAVTVRSALPSNFRTMQLLYDILFYLVLFGFPVLLIFFGWRRGHKFEKTWRIGLLSGILWAFLSFLTGMQSYYGANDLIPAAQFAVYGYGGAFSFLWLVVLSGLLFVSGFGLWLITTYLARRRG